MKDIIFYRQPSGQQILFSMIDELPDSLVELEEDPQGEESPESEIQKLVKKKAFFPVSHDIEDRFGNKFTPYEKHFYTTLCRLNNRLANSDGWFWHTDEQFAKVGFSRTKLSAMRKKYKEAGFIDTRSGRTKGGFRGGTEYRLLDIV